MAHWNTHKFVKAFMEGALGRKRVHGTYRVLVGDHCKLLVRASTEYGRPSGSELIAIRLDHDELDVGFFHGHNTGCFTYRMNRDMDMYNAPKLPGSVLEGDDPNLKASGVIDVEGNDVLIEIGDKPYLLHRQLKDDGTPAQGWAMSEEASLSNTYITRFESLDIVSKRVASVAAARELVKDPVGMSIVCNLWWVEKMPDTFTPPPVEDKYSEALQSPINPFDHGYKIEDCSTAITIADEGINRIKPDAVLLNEPHDHRAKSYLAAKEVWNIACKKIHNRTPLDWKGLTSKKNRYSYSTSKEERVGYIVTTTSGVYLKGKFSSVDNWETATRLDGWHKAHTQCQKVLLNEHTI